jgi:bifunctional UDP-N-acetylglucosamine pyrophosphorylase/glucosamine-1-phosphate N-acetyltransferase
MTSNLFLRDTHSHYPHITIRARHHSYIGDATVGKNVNFGASSITANFDGEKVNLTNIGDNCYIGSGTVLIAPLELAEGSNVSAGTVVSQKSVNKLGGKAKVDVS